MARVLQNVAQRGLQVHGALGASDEMPLARLLHLGALMALVDGPSEVHRTTAAKTLLKQGRPADGMWPSEWIPAKLEAASAKYADLFGDRSELTAGRIGLNSEAVARECRSGFRRRTPSSGSSTVCAGQMRAGHEPRPRSSLR